MYVSLRCLNASSIAYTHTLTNTGLLSRRDVSVDEALSIQSSSSSVLLRALDLDRNNDEVSSLIKN